MIRSAWAGACMGVLLSVCGPGAHAASLPATAAEAASAASAPQVRRGSPYARAARQHAMEASATATPKVNPLIQHRPRLPASMRHG
ncbi:MAG TPA: hypothetical protein VIN75_02990 [Burkholderiaceae bacterium]